MGLRGAEAVGGVRSRERAIGLEFRLFFLDYGPSVPNWCKNLIYVELLRKLFSFIKLTYMVIVKPKMKNNILITKDEETGNAAILGTV